MSDESTVLTIMKVDVNDRIQMELDTRKNEAKADLKQMDIKIEVRFLPLPWDPNSTFSHRNF